MAYDLLIKDVRIIDGSGMPSFNGDVVVSNGHIVEVGRIDGDAQQTIDADGQVVAPLEQHMVADLPAGERRLVQKAQGYKALVVNGQVLMEDGEHTGAYPGRILRSA